MIDQTKALPTSNKSQFISSCQTWINEFSTLPALAIVISCRRRPFSALNFPDYQVLIRIKCFSLPGDIFSKKSNAFYWNVSYIVKQIIESLVITLMNLFNRNMVNVFMQNYFYFLLRLFKNQSYATKAVINIDLRRHSLGPIRL